jgi:hypothetical protein
VPAPPEEPAAAPPAGNVRPVHRVSSPFTTAGTRPGARARTGSILGLHLSDPEQPDKSEAE